MDNLDTFFNTYLFYALKIWFLHKNSDDIHDIRKNTQKTAMFLHNSGF